MNNQSFSQSRIDRKAISQIHDVTSKLVVTLFQLTWITWTFLCLRSSRDHWGLVGVFAAIRCLKACKTPICWRLSLAACSTTPLWNSCSFSSQSCSLKHKVPVTYEFQTFKCQFANAKIHTGILLFRNHNYTVHSVKSSENIIWHNYPISLSSFLFVCSFRFFSFFSMSFDHSYFPLVILQDLQTDSNYLEIKFLQTEVKLMEV